MWGNMHAIFCAYFEIIAAILYIFDIYIYSEVPVKKISQSVNTFITLTVQKSYQEA